MRKTNNLPWMGRTVATAIMVLVGLGVFAGSASAQASMVYKYADAEAWWDLYECKEMRILLGAADDSETAAGGASMSAACKSFAELTTARQRRIENFIDPVGAGMTEGTHTNMVGPHASHKVWWTAIITATPATTGPSCATAQALTGMRAIPDDTANDAAVGANKILVCRAYDGSGGLRPAEMDLVMNVGNALSGRGAMMTDDEDEEEAPALPLVGIGLLGLLLAGRGAWLRRRA